MKTFRLLILLSVFLIFVSTFKPQQGAAASGDLTKGKSIYESNCLTCHGQRGKGDGPMAAVLNPPPADLTSAKIKAKSVQELIAVIRDGRGVMPGWKTRLQEHAIQNVLAYLLSLGE